MGYCHPLQPERIYPWHIQKVRNKKRHIKYIGSLAKAIFNNHYQILVVDNSWEVV
jgi:hypothetical protein